MKVPQPRFEFGDIVFIKQQHTNFTYEDCPDCFEGQLHVSGPKGPLKTVTCQKCNGSGHSYKIVNKNHYFTIDGMMQITGIRIELNQNPRNDGFGFEGVMYQGRVMWRDDVPNNENTSNIFREPKLLSFEQLVYGKE